MTCSFKSSFVRVCLDYMIGVYGRTINPKTCILMTATGIAALGRVLLTSLLSEEENITIFSYTKLFRSLFFFLSQISFWFCAVD